MKEAIHRDSLRNEFKRGVKLNINLVRKALCMSDLVENIKKSIIQQTYQQNPDIKEAILLIENYYTKIELSYCNINIFALKKLIKWNLKSLRSIKINKCIFHLSDNEANEHKNPVSNSRMFQEIDFVYLIQTFQFFDIEEIDIDLIKESSVKGVDQELGQKILLKDLKDKKRLLQFEVPSSQNQVEPYKEHEILSFDNKSAFEIKKDSQQSIMTMQELIQEFACEKECRLISYEQVEKPSFIKTFQQSDQNKIAQDLIWGDLINPKKMDDQLNINKIEDINQNLRFYKSYTKYALMENKLLILGDVLYNNISLQQLYNLIQINYKIINSIIFKDTGRIPSKAFSDLMNQLFIIPQIDEISFLSSVVEEESFKDLQYLIGSKKVQFMVIYRSHFLQTEIDKLFQMHATKKTPLVQVVNINHNRYSILDLFSKTYHEFTPFAFQTNLNTSLLSRQDIDQSLLNNAIEVQDIELEKAYSLMMDVEKLYERQQSYPKLIYNRIIFYQGKNLSIISKNVSDRILFKYWIFVKKTQGIKSKQDNDQIRKAKLEIKQEELISDLDSVLNQDDLSVVNCGLINILIGMIQEQELKNEYYGLYKQQKSYKNLKSKYPIGVVENIRYSEKYYLATALAYLMGFTKIQEQSLYFFINNQELHESLCENRNDFSNLETKEYSLIIKESVKIGLDLESVNNLTQVIDFNKLTHLNLDGIRENTTFSYLTAVFAASINLRILTMRECLLNMNKIKSINFALISEELQELDLSRNRDIDDFEFINNIFSRAKYLRKLVLEDMQISKSRLEKVNFKLTSKSLELLNLSDNNLNDSIEILASLLEQTTSLKQLKLAQCQLDLSLLKQIKFPNSIEHINISENYNLEFYDFLDILPNINQPYLTYLELKELNINIKSNKNQSSSQQPVQNNLSSNQPNNNDKFLKIEEIVFHRNSMSETSKVNEILSLCKNMRKFHLSYQNIDDVQINNLKFDNLYDKILKIDLSYNYLIKKCDFLNKFFEKFINLQQFIMRYCALSNEKLNNVNFSLLNEGLQEFDFSGNSDISSLSFLNDLMKKCQRLKILNLEQMKITDVKLKEIDFSLISPLLEELNLSNNDQLTRFYFLNEIFRKARGLKRVNLAGILLDENQIDNISFDNISLELESFKIQERKDSQKKSFTDWLIKKLNRYLNIYRFQKHHANVDLFPYLNYYGISESFNLTQYRMSKEEINFKQKRVQTREAIQSDLNIIFSLPNINMQNIDHKDIILKSQFDKRISLVNANQNLILKRQKQEQEQKRVHLSEAVNIFYFYSFFKKLEQIITKDNDRIPKLNKEDSQGNTSQVVARKSKEDWRSFLDKIIEDQNVYVDLKYLLLQYINDKSLLEKVDLENVQPEDLIQFIKILDLSNKKCVQNSFITFVFSRCDMIQKMYLQKMQQQLQDFFKLEMFKQEKSIKFSHFNHLEELNISENQGNLSLLINEILKNAPNLKTLNISNCNLKDDNLFQVDLLPHSLLDLDLSYNKNLNNLSFLNTIFKKCLKLKSLNISNMELSHQKLIEVQFSLICTELEVINLSNNNSLTDISEIINSIIVKCKKLQVLDISNFNIHHNYIKDEKAIRFSEISPHLKEINLSKNSIVFFMGFLANLLKAAPNLEKIDLSYQQHLNSYDSQVITVPPNKLKILNISGNLIHNTFQYATEIISKSQCFEKLIVQEFNLQIQRFSSLVDQNIADKIEELDISNNDKIIDINPLNQLNRTNKLRSLIARNTCLNNYLINQLDKQAIFTNLQNLDFAYNVSILDYSFFNELFKIATNLTCLNISYMQATQEMIEQIDFSQTPTTLSYFDISGNDYIINLQFLNSLFQRTSKSLKNLFMSSMNLNDEQFSNIDFNLLADCIEYIDFSKNLRLNKILFLSKLMNDSNATLKKVKLDRFIFDVRMEDQYSQIEKLECDHIKYKYNFFTHEKYVANINIIKFIKFLQISYKKNYLENRREEVEERFGTIFQLFLKQLLKNQSEHKNLQVLLHFFFLLFNEERLKLEEKKEMFFIFSPYFLFQKSKIVDFKGFDENKRQNLMFDSYNLTFFNFDLVEQGMKYIFSYDKFYFPNFNEFYIQDFKNQLSNEGIDGDITFLKNMNNLIKEKKAEQAFLPLKITLSEDTLRTTSINEFELLYFINRVPPASIQLKNMSIQFVKSWYVINFYAPLSCNTQIDIDFELIENTSIGNYLTMNCYKWIIQSYREKSIGSFIKFVIGQFGYFIFKIFYTLPQQFRFDHTVILLERQLKISSSSQTKRYNILRFLFPLYQFVCIFGILFFSLAQDVGCGQGISWYSYIMYGGYGFLTFLLEADQFVLCLEYVKHLIPEFKPDCQTQFPNNIINSLKQKLVDLNWLNMWYLNYSISFIQSQITRFDYFTDISFLYSLYTCNEFALFWISFTGLAIHLLFNILFYIYTFTGATTYEKLATGRIDKLYQVCNLVQFQAVAELLNIISPSNSITFRKRMFNQKIINTFSGILFENIPQIIIQIIYLSKKNVLSINVLFSIISSCIMFITNLYKFLTVIPTRLGQEDFNSLNSKKRNQVLPIYQQKLQEYESNLLKYNLVEQLKCIKSTLYYKRLLIESGKTPSQIYKEINIAKELRRFQHNIDLIEYFFGNTLFIDKPEQLEQFLQQNNNSPSTSNLHHQEVKHSHEKSHFQPILHDNLSHKDDLLSNKGSILDHKETNPLITHKKIEMSQDYSSTYLNKSNQILQQNEEVGNPHHIQTKPVHIQQQSESKIINSKQNKPSSKSNLGPNKQN